MSKKIELPDDLPRRLGDKYAKIATITAHFNGAKDHNMRAHYLGELRGQASLVADASVDALKHSTLTTDQKVELMGDHRAAGQQLLAICDAAVI